jgi:hypothetical protein
MENVVIFYDHLESFTAIRYNVLPFGIVCCHLVHLLHFGMFRPIWQPCSSAEQCEAVLTFGNAAERDWKIVWTYIPCKRIIPKEYLKHFFVPWRRGAMDITSASGTRRPGFESRQDIRFLGKHRNAVVYKMT